MRDSELMKKYSQIVEGKVWREFTGLDAQQAAQAFEEFSMIKEEFGELIDRLEQTVQAYTPSLKENLRAYMIGHLKSAIGGYGYHTYNTTLEDILEQLEMRMQEGNDIPDDEDEGPSGGPGMR